MIGIFVVVVVVVVVVDVVVDVYNFGRCRCI